MSLGLFQLRQYMLDELFTELNRFVENSKMYSPKDRQTLLNVYNKKIRSVLSQCCSTPRLPLEMLRIVKPPRHYATDFQFLFKAADPDEERVQLDFILILFKKCCQYFIVFYLCNEKIIL